MQRVQEAQRIAADVAAATGSQDVDASPAGREKWVVGLRTGKSPRRLQAALEAAGFEVLAVETISFTEAVATVRRR